MATPDNGYVYPFGLNEQNFNDFMVYLKGLNVLCYNKVKDFIPCCFLEKDIRDHLEVTLDPVYRNWNLTRRSKPEDIQIPEQDLKPFLDFLNEKDLPTAITIRLYWPFNKIGCFMHPNMVGIINRYYVEFVKDYDFKLALAEELNKRFSMQKDLIATTEQLIISQAKIVGPLRFTDALCLNLIDAPMVITEMREIDLCLFDLPDDAPPENDLTLIREQELREFKLREKLVEVSDEDLKRFSVDFIWRHLHRQSVEEIVPLITMLVGDEPSSAVDLMNAILKTLDKYVRLIKKSKMNPNDKSKYTCQVCSHFAPTQCSCRSVYYCGEKCQKQDWLVHKDYCQRIRGVHK